MTRLDCQYSHLCSGCDAITHSYETQKNQKLATLRNLLESFALPEIQFISFGTHGLRSRLDFTMENGNRGLYSHIEKKIVDLPICLQLSQPLQSALQKFRELKPPVQKGSFRIRVSPQNEIGFWLDFSNEDIKQLLESRDYLENLQKIGFVEIGQRHKVLYQKPTGELGLGQPEFHKWSETRFQNKTIPLLSTVASFTQPSHISNSWITSKIEYWCELIRAENILEFGSGIGNLSFPALVNKNSKLTALEYDGISFQALEKNVQTLGLENRVTLHKGDYRKNSSIDLAQFDLLLLNPARNGVGDLLNQKLSSKNIIYMSCYPESLALDTQNLNNQGYSLQELIIVDQFPQTHHMEVLSLWRQTT
jgi:23S rRNA (uracil1939-C5)-methyltransferase